MTAHVDQAVADANRAVNEAIGRSYARRQFTISKFARHPDGYLHARVVVDGKPFYFTRRYGSWQAPGQVGHQPVQKEPEALLGSQLGREVKFALSEKSHPFDRAARREREAAEEAQRRANRTSEAPANSQGDDDPVRPDRVPDGGDQDDAPPAVQPD